MSFLLLFCWGAGVVCWMTIGWGEANAAGMRKQERGSTLAKQGARCGRSTTGSQRTMLVPYAGRSIHPGAREGILAAARMLAGEGILAGTRQPGRKRAGHTLAGPAGGTGEAGKRSSPY